MVLDASAALAWCFEDLATVESLALLRRLDRAPAEVPQLWPLEVAHALSRAERAGRLAPAKLTAFLGHLATLDIRIDGSTASRALDHTLDLARATGLSAYDACYLELAVRRSLPLATRDAKLAAEARKAGVAVIEA